MCGGGTFINQNEGDAGAHNVVVLPRFRQLRFMPPTSAQDNIVMLRAGFADHSFWIAIAISMKRIAIGYSISVAVGIVLGLLLASSEFLEQALGGLLVSLQSLPSICWLPMAVLWFGLSEKAILFAVIMGSVL
jgi:NitT/TauT family transport system permease protein